MNTITIIHHLVYILISAGLTIWVGQMLFKNGRVFLLDAFDGHQVMADSVNRLLIVGFYLINFGIVSLFLKFGSRPGDMVDFIELMSVKIGIVLLILGIMHFFNMFNIAKMRRKALRKKSQPAPVAPAQS
ncbi:MAG: hypothetical protein R3264_19655 [Anaerolineae bacterium]|nr:hypothetical protein [Anaerolineae bacterium]